MRIFYYLIYAKAHSVENGKGYLHHKTNKN